MQQWIFDLFKLILCYLLLGKQNMWIQNLWVLNTTMRNHCKFILMLFWVCRAHQNFTVIKLPSVQHIGCFFNLKTIWLQIDFGHDNYTTIVPYQSSRHIYIENVCRGGLPVTNFGINSPKYSMSVGTCKNVHVRSICQEAQNIPDYIPRNYQFLCRFNCDRLYKKSLTCRRNNVVVTAQLGMMKKHVEIFSMFWKL